jgi:ubiquinone/menaquinone biosynthesis C-methylase UbiE
MSWLSLLLLIAALLIIWEIWICEGAHLGRRFVIWLYDLAAGRYDGIKSFDFDWERRFIGEPIVELLSPLFDAKVLDVGAGTGRVARTLLPFKSFTGTIVSTEPSKKMLSLGKSLAPSPRAPWLRAFAVPLPFHSNSFDLVVSLEILEFTPNPKKTIGEMLRVLRPGGWMIVSNRVSWEAKWIVGRTFPRDQFKPVLASLGLKDITVYPWQVDYDLAWARKADAPSFVERAG